PLVATPGKSVVGERWRWRTRRQPPRFRRLVNQQNRTMKWMRFLAAITVVIAIAASRQHAAAAEPGWTNQVIARGALRQTIRATPIEQRPYRPLHIYGNTIRRIHHRGTPLPSIAEVVALPLRLILPR